MRGLFQAFTTETLTTQRSHNAGAALRASPATQLGPGPVPVPVLEPEPVPELAQSSPTTRSRGRLRAVSDDDVELLGNADGFGLGRCNGENSTGGVKSCFLAKIFQRDIYLTANNLVLRNRGMELE